MMNPFFDKQGVTAVNESARLYWDELEKCRVLDAKKIYYWYYNYKDEIIGYIKAGMNKSFTPTTVEKMNIRLYNIVGRIIDKLALVYKNHPNRTLDGGIIQQTSEAGEIMEIQSKDDITYQKLLEKSTVEIKETEWEKLCKVFNTVLIQPVWKENYMDFNIHTPAWCIVISDAENYLIPKAFYYPIWKQLKKNQPAEQILVYWSETEHFYLDANENRIAPENNDGMINPYGILPIAVLRKKTGIDFWGEGIWDLVDGNEEICIQLSNLFFTALFQSHGQPFGINIDENQWVIGPDKPILVKGVFEGMVQPDLKFVQANPLLGEIQELIDWAIKTSQAIKGLGPQQFGLEASVASGISKVIDTTDIKEMREDDIKILKSFETDLYDVTKTVWNYHNVSQISDDAEFKVTFREPKVIESVDEKIKLQDAGIRNGTISRVDIIMERESCTEKEAIEKLKKIIIQQRMFEDKFGLFEEELIEEKPIKEKLTEEDLIEEE